nr:uncharacterized protein LOC108178092 [Oryctolagus cuniculus]
MGQRERNRRCAEWPAAGRACVRGGQWRNSGRGYASSLGSPAKGAEIDGFPRVEFCLRKATRPKSTSCTQSSKVTLGATCRRRKSCRQVSAVLLAPIPKSPLPVPGLPSPSPSPSPPPDRAEARGGRAPRAPRLQKPKSARGDRFPLHCSQVNNKDGGDPRPKGFHLTPTAA